MRAIRIRIGVRVRVGVRDRRDVEKLRAPPSGIIVATY